MFTLRRAAFRLLASPSTGYLSKTRAISTAPSFLRAPKSYTPITFHRRWASSEAEAKEDAPISEVEPTPSEEIENAVHEDAADAEASRSTQETAAAASEGATSTTEPEERSAEDTKNWDSTDPATTSSEQDPTRTQPDLSHEPKSMAQETMDTVHEKVQDATEAASGVASYAAASASDLTGTGQTGQQSPQGGDQSFEPKPTIYVGNLFFDVTENDLVKAFSEFGKISRARLVRDARGLSKGFGYIDFETVEAASQAIDAMNQKVFEGRRLRIQFAAFTSKTIDERAQKARSTPQNPPSKTLFIGNMSFEMTDRDLNQLFRSIKNVIDVRVAIDRRTGQPRGFAHADFIDIQSAVEGMEVLKQKEVYGRQLRVDFSLQPDRQHPRSRASS